jgi:hypothetical protein
MDWRMEASERVQAFQHVTNRDPSTPGNPIIGIPDIVTRKKKQKTLYARTGMNLRQSADDNDKNTNKSLWSVTNPSKVNY